MLKGPPLPPPKHPTLDACLSAAARTDFGLTFIDAGEREYFVSWSEVRRRARRTAAGLERVGVRPGDRVAILLPTCPEFMDAFFGTLYAGAVPVPLYPPVRLGRLEEYHRATARMLELTGAALVLTDARVRLLLGQAVAMARPRLGCRTVAQVITRDVELSVPTVSSDLALIQFSSGSTVDPKPVALTHGQIVAQLSALQQEIPARPDLPRVGVSWLPLYHDMGLIGCLLLAAYHPGSLVLIPPEVFLARPALWLRAISRHRALVSPAPNFAFGLCQKRISDRDLEGVDLSCWYHALNGAEPVAPATLARFADRFARWGFREEAFRPVYGLSEAALAVAFPPMGRGPASVGVDARLLAREGRVATGGRKVVSVGRPVAGFEIEIRDEVGWALPEGRCGRIFVRGPSVMAGYYGAPSATAAAMADGGWLDTGDLGFARHGELFVTGRAKDLVIIRGANHAPQEFESCLEGISGLRAGCAVALGFVPRGETDEALLILAEHERNADLVSLEGRVREAILSGTGVRPHTVALLAPGTLPRTSSGKMRRREALVRYESGTLRPPRSVSRVGLAKEMAQSAVAFVRAGR